MTHIVYVSFSWQGLQVMFRTKAIETRSNAQFQRLVDTFELRGRLIA